MMGGKLTKTEWVLVGLTGVFLCGLLGLHTWDQRRAASGALETERAAAQESFMPDVSPLDLNTASAEELTALPGIGPELARRIVEHRETAGPFTAVEELLEVPGIGEAKLAALEGRVIVNGEA
nr:helix-hairpin-helix domain-containing protein [uncultured Dysosmobacter sp.]